MDESGMWICPICGLPLTAAEKCWRCGRQHSFDRSRSGYVHLLPANRKHGKMPGDDKLMVDARRRFLEGGWYAPLADALCARLSSYMPAGGGLLDVFDRMTGYTFQNQFLGSMRTAVWNCLLQKNLQPAVDWAKDFWQMSLLRKATFLYGGVRLGQTVANYWKM